MKKYNLTEDLKTVKFYQEISNSANKYIKTGYPIAKALARSLYQKAGIGGYFWRSVCGGKYLIQNTIKQGPNCLDYSFALNKILKKYYQLESTVKECQLVLVKNHQYILTSNNEVLDLIIGIPEYPEGYFQTEKIYLNELNKINNQKNKLIFKQIKAILFPNTRKKLC